MVSKPRLGASVCSSLIREGENRHTHSDPAWLRQEGSSRTGRGRMDGGAEHPAFVFLFMANLGSSVNKICVFPIEQDRRPKCKIKNYRSDLLKNKHQLKITDTFVQYSKV